ncbi:LysR family transcriptional regulator [Pseudohalocynthiibacter sp. F2068]|uniref:LysR family transcriptional regulator n=1 Tax=Pseudohalocynthiibacter sp. F2068 TaxID=2926418 RepID=UPI001FF2738F|nr:LysR family transcriptional regulator [Pseudohalocynthiibacter sp. F2068]MCK0104588.1 LysR family transcriptional regulator [Pseudohalocynthiibacter sp. F2068]
MTSPIKKRVSFNWNDLVFFIEVCRQKSLAGASRRLGVDHSTVGRRIRELEDSLNTKLFDRSGTGYHLTESGLRLLDKVEKMEGVARQIGQSSDEGGHGLVGTVRIATMEAIGSLYLAPRLAQFALDNPDIHVELVTAASWISLSRREADILISFPPPKGRRLQIEKIGQFSLFLYASEQYLNRVGQPSSIKDLTDHNLIDYVDDLVQIDAVRWLGEVCRVPEGPFKSSSLIAQFTATQGGAGICMLPSFVAHHAPDLIPVLQDEAYVWRDIWLTAHEDHLHHARIRKVMQFLREMVGQDQDRLNQP